MSTNQRTCWLNATVFLTGAGLMTIELVASRLIARFLGSSLYTWTGVLGVILAGMSLGNYLGGRMADAARNLPRRISGMLFAAAAACLAILWLNAWAGGSVFLMKLSWPVRIVLHMTWAFLLPATVLGTISPMVAKLAIERAAHTGRAIGTLYAWNAVGSIAGTLLTGFVLTAWMGSVRIVVSMALLLAVLGLLYALASRREGAAGRGAVAGAAAGTALAALFFGLTVLPGESAAHVAGVLRLRDGPIEDDAVYFAETQYQILTVTAEPGNPSHRAFYQDKLRHSEVDLSDLGDLKYPYMRIYDGLRQQRAGANADPIRLLCLGGGGYAYPQHLFATRPRQRNHRGGNRSRRDPGGPGGVWARRGRAHGDHSMRAQLPGRRRAPKTARPGSVPPSISSSAIPSATIPCPTTWTTREFLGGCWRC